MPDDQQHVHRRRDAEALTIIGCFFVLLAGLVLIGVIVHRDEGMAVGIGAGVLLMLIGAAAVYVGARLRRKPE
jgi:hypothetical protein